LYEYEAFVGFIIFMGWWWWCLINAVNFMGWREFNGHLKQEYNYCQMKKGFGHLNCSSAAVAAASILVCFPEQDDRHK